MFYICFVGKAVHLRSHKRSGELHQEPAEEDPRAIREARWAEKGGVGLIQPSPQPQNEWELLFAQCSSEAMFGWGGGGDRQSAAVGWSALINGDSSFGGRGACCCELCFYQLE